MKLPKKVTLIHPFTPQAAGVVERSVATYHSQPHAKALQQLVANNANLQGEIAYLTPKRRSYNFKFGNIGYQFYPVTRTLNGDHKKWKKQWSKACLKGCERAIPDVTIINMSGHSSPFSYMLAKIILAQNKQYIAMLGGQHYTDTPENRIYYKKAHHILVHTQLQKKQMLQLPMFKDCDIRVFPLGVDTQEFQPKQNKTETHPNLLYVGRIVEWKRVHLAIKALHELVIHGFDNAKLTIIGPIFSELYYNELKKMVSDLKLEEHIKFIGHLEHNKLPKHFQNANLFLLPSDKETFGMVMIEAMACGTPVAGINCPGGPKDVISHNLDGILATPETYAQSVLEYFSNNTQRTAIEQAARTKVMQHYSLQATYKVLEQSVNEALKHVV
ncbi:glycosyltransferase family 4 protein [Mangrovimonas cancribranchiae]|uniref:Glycosyltransferase family 4 protein n=1 Tax=Mangrovimonas cancribranchiae TaxID=3080055 RepID=A0AAU6P112_9FLAO